VIRIILAISALLWASAALAQDNAKPVLEFIGTASMSADGIVTVHLTRTADGKYVNGTFTYKPGDPDYAKTLQHIGGLKPGETKPVKPWPD
jgi:hypothetical protein